MFPHAQGNSSWSGRQPMPRKRWKSGGKRVTLPCSPAGRGSSPELQPPFPSVPRSLPWLQARGRAGAARCWRGAGAVALQPGVPGQRILAVCRPCGGGCLGRLVSRGQGTGRRVRVGSKEPLSLRRPVGALNAEFSLGALGRCAAGPPVAAALSARRRSAELTASGRTRR